jgi:hypothetical protein
LVAGDLVEDALFVARQAGEGGGAGQALGHEIAREVELLIVAQDVVELPGAFQ